MSFLTQGVTGASRIVTEQPTLNSSNDLTGLKGVQNAGGWIPAIERAILKVGVFLMYFFYRVFIIFLIYS